MLKYENIKTEELYELYITQNLATTEISKILHIPRTCLRRLLTRRNIVKTPEQMSAMRTRIRYVIENNLTDEQRQHKAEANRRAFFKLSKEERKRRTALLVIANKTRSPESKAKKVKLWREALARETPEQRALRIKHISEGTKCAMQNLPEEKKAEMQRKRSEKWQSKSKEEQMAWAQKVIETKRKNNTFNVSEPEKKIKQLLESKFSDIKYQYKSEKYPFMCDFYIPELDLYIEYQGHWSHNKKPFEGTAEDLIKVNKWKSRNTKFYKAAINTWTIRDPLKRETAKKNNLNWLEFFNIQQFMNWFNKL